MFKSISATILAAVFSVFIEQALWLRAIEGAALGGALFVVVPMVQGWAESKLTQGLYIDCSLAHTSLVKAASDGSLYALMLTSVQYENHLSKLGNGLPFQDYKFPEEAQLWIHKCNIANYGSSPVVNVSFELAIEFRESLTSGPTDSVMSGKVVHSRGNPISIAKIDPGTQSVVSFYLMNFTDQFVDVTMPTRATVRYLDSDRTRTVRVMSPFDQSVIHLGPPGKM